MDYLEKFRRQFYSRLLLLLASTTLLVGVDWLLAEGVFRLTGYTLIIGLAFVPILLIILLPLLATKYFTAPLKLLWQAILHLAPTSQEHVAAPSLDSIRFGRELVSSLTTQLYQLATVTDSVSHQLEQKSNDLHTNTLATTLPLPLLVLDKDFKIIFANEAATQYIELKEADLIGKDVHSMLDLSFQTEATLDAWLASVQQDVATASHTWERVRLTVPAANKTLLFDLAAYYNKANPLGHEITLVLFDHNARYASDDQAMGLVAMAAHELRTPLTLLRGYIEAFEEDTTGKLDPQDADYLHKMDAAGQQLVSFINNVLNVARIEDDQFIIKLHEEKWSEIIAAAVQDMQLRAGVQGITIETNIVPDLPSVGVDRVSIYEVLNNLIDNAIKYSSASKQIIVSSKLTEDGLIETSVQDFGIGIPESIVPNLFDKFYRSHRSRAQISGTGLGLYLSKTIIAAHGGNIWVRSKEGQGSIFSFTVLPYAKIASTAKGQEQDLTRTAHGWIKNHSLYRR